MGGRHYYLGRELAKKGYRVYLIASASHHLLREKPALKEPFEIEAIAEGFNLVWVNMPSYAEAHSRQRALNWFLFPWRIQRLVNFIRDKPDVILSSSPSPVAFLGAQRLAKKFKARLVFEVRDIWPLTLTELGGYSSKHPFIRFMQWVEDKAYRDSDAVVSNLKNSVEHMVERGMQREKFAWIANGFSLDEVNSGMPLDASTKRMLPKGKFLVGYTGTFGLANDLYTLIDAAELLKGNDDVVFVLVGGGRDKHSLLSYIEKKKLKNVITLDYVPKTQVQQLLMELDVLTVGAKKQPIYKFGVSPNKLFDYLYAAKPIIYHIESGDYSPVKSASAGYEVESGNPQALASAILKVYRMSTIERELMGANGRRAALEQYEYNQLSEKFAEVLFDL
jgi:glycosyltransferase involved in cell wall biosynthesis